ncbi:MAG: hypothetical protein Q8N04_05120 [Nitrospira sp.]|nr:hypothetical protein [Nitrospira sp.]
MTRLGLAALLTFPLLTACTSSLLDLREHFDVHRSSFEEKLAGDSAKAEQFRTCTQQAHDGSSLPIRTAAGTPAARSVGAPITVGGRLRAPVQALVERIHEEVGNKATSFSVLSDMADDFADPSRRRVDLDKLHRLTDAIRHWQAHLDFDEEAFARDTSLFAQLFLAYSRAYFGDVRYALAPNPASGTVRGIVQVTSRGFVDRSGNTVRFPGLSAAAQADETHAIELAATSIDSRRVSADLTRIFLEAFFDATFRVPAVQQATALRLPATTASYPAFDPAHPPISLDALAAVSRNALRTEAVATSLVGKAVRGGSLFGTNNETVAATLETAAGVFAKKLVEHEGFCYFQVTQHP